MPNNKIEKRKRITLTSKEISELFAEAIVTIVLLILLNIAIIVIFSSIVNYFPSLNDAIFETRNSFVRNFDSTIFLSGKNLVVPLFIILSLLSPLDFGYFSCDFIVFF